MRARCAFDRKKYAEHATLAVTTGPPMEQANDLQDTCENISKHNVCRTYNQQLDGVIVRLVSDVVQGFVFLR